MNSASGVSRSLFTFSGIVITNAHFCIFQRCLIKFIEEAKFWYRKSFNFYKKKLATDWRDKLTIELWWKNFPVLNIDCAPPICCCHCVRALQGLIFHIHKIIHATTVTTACFSYMWRLNDVERNKSGEKAKRFVYSLNCKFNSMPRRSLTTIAGFPFQWENISLWFW